MRERKSKKMNMLLHATWRLFKACLCVQFVAVIFMAYWFCETSDQYLQIKFDYYAQTKPADNVIYPPEPYNSTINNF